MNLINIAIKKASQSHCRSKISALGFNKKGEFLGATSNKPRFERYGGGLHAEHELIKRYGKNIKTIIVCRVGLAGEIRPVGPCNKCDKLANVLGIKIVSILGEYSPPKSKDNYK